MPTFNSEHGPEMFGAIVPLVSETKKVYFSDIEQNHNP